MLTLLSLFIARNSFSYKLWVPWPSYLQYLYGGSFNINLCKLFPTPVFSWPEPSFSLFDKFEILINLWPTNLGRRTETENAIWLWINFITCRVCLFHLSLGHDANTYNLHIFYDEIYAYADWTSRSKSA